jgi:hypothetical protein
MNNSGSVGRHKHNMHLYPNELSDQGEEERLRRNEGHKAKRTNL